jgi:anthranilate synthase/aminodeoxychorismate synthase-like glutamine amidotransferase
MKRVLIIDNFDSFTYNLVDEFEKRKCDVLVYRNNTPMDKIGKIVKGFNPALIVISPGPGTPAKAGNSKGIIKKYSGKIPVFGVCLGLQAITEVFGGRIGRCSETVHGKPSAVRHDGKTIFKGTENPFHAGRYHSLVAVRVPKALEVSATSEKVVMGIRHRKHFTEGVQFHPESILTPEGGKIIGNLISMLGGAAHD